MKTHKPKVLRDIDSVIHTKVKYSVGIVDSEDNYGGTNGPFDRIEDCLELIGDKGEVIVKHSNIDTVIWKWDAEAMVWVELEEPIIL